VVDVAQRSAGTIVWRGFRRRCGRCGAKDIFASYLKLRERCPVCGYRFVREAGAFTGVMLMNITATFALMFLSLIAYVLWRGVTGEDVSIWPFAIACLAFAAVVPLVFYPVATSWWAAMDLAMRPLDEAEVRDAHAHASR
jgi:uncharacterized protein (DUF983 family)